MYHYIRSHPPPLILEQLWEVCLMWFVNEGLAAVELMDPLNCWPPSPLQYPPS